MSDSVQNKFMYFGQSFIASLEYLGLKHSPRE